MPFLIRMVDAITPDTFTAAKLVSMLAGLLFLAASMRVVKPLFGDATSLITGLLLLLNPLVLIYSTTSLSDMLAAAWLMAALWCLLRADKPVILFLGAVSLGFAWSTRSIYIVFWPLLAAPFLEQWGQRRWQAGALALAGLSVGCVYQGAINWQFFGSPFHSDNWRNIAALVYGWDGLEQVHSARQMLVERGPQLALLWTKRFVIQIPEGLFHSAFWPFLLATPGYVAATPSTRRPLYYLWGITTLVYLFLLAPVWRIELRYFLPVLPLALGSGVAMWRAMSGHRPYLLAMGVLFACLISLGAAIENVGEMVESQGPEYREAGRFLAAHAQPDDIVLATQPHVFFYADLRGKQWGDLKSQNMDEIDRAVELEDIDWVVFDARRGGWEFPQFKALLDPASEEVLSYGWKPTHSINSPSQLVVWRVHQ